MGPFCTEFWYEQLYDAELFCDLLFRVGFYLTEWKGNALLDYAKDPTKVLAWASHYKELLERYFPRASKGKRCISADQELPRGETGYALLTTGTDGYQKSATVLRGRGWRIDPYAHL